MHIKCRIQIGLLQIIYKISNFGLKRDHRKAGVGLHLNHIKKIDILLKKLQMDQGRILEF